MVKIIGSKAIEDIKNGLPVITKMVDAYMESKILNPSIECEIDYCYNYFHSTENLLNDVEKSCLVLAYFLKQQTQFGLAQTVYSYTPYHWIDMIKYFQELKDADHPIWHLDVNQYSSDNILKIVDVYTRLTQLVYTNDTLSRVACVDFISNMMMAVFGCIPGFDSRFNIGFREVVWKAGEDAEIIELVDVHSLNFIGQFYNENAEEISALVAKYSTSTLDPKTSSCSYTIARIIDMYAYECSDLTLLMIFKG